MSGYQLIAFDMDGTLLNSQKQVSAGSLAAIDRALAAGKQVILCTGRGLAELADFAELLQRLSFCICASGAVAYRLPQREALFHRPLLPQQVCTLLDLAAQEGAMMHLLTDRSIVQNDHCAHMDQYGMGVYQPMYQRVTDQWEDVRRQYEAAPFPVSKCNLYHTDDASRTRTERRIRDKGLVVEVVRAERTSLEISAAGVDKGTGLRELCRQIGVPIHQTIAVGDANNDIGMFRVAGLAVAMGNAEPDIQALAGAVVADCDHDGCAEAIDRYLL